MYHAVVFSADKQYFANHFILHVFCRDRPNVSELSNLMRSLSEKHKDALMMETEPRYVGVERLPIDIGEGWFFFARPYKRWKEVKETLQFIESAGSVDLRKLSEWKRWRLTVDYDGKDPVGWSFSVIEKLGNLKGLVKSFYIYRTPAGAHLRAELSQPMTFEEKMKLRRELGDDHLRLEHDEAFHRLGFEALADILFNEKTWDNFGVWKSYSEEPLVVESAKLSFNIPMKLEIGDVVIDGDTIKFGRPIYAVDAYSIVRSIEDNLWEYKYTTTTRERAELKDMIIKAYSEISQSLSSIVSRCSISYDGGFIVIHIPKELSMYVGRLIGKQGTNVRYVEQKLGVRIRISQETPPPEDVQLKQRLQGLLRTVLSGGS